VRALRILAGAAALLTLCLVVLGAYVRIADAGLACPDWPGCYGQWTVPASAEELRAAARAYPQRPLDRAKAWIEMTHRYLALGLGLLLLGLAAVSWRLRHRLGRSARAAPFLLLLLAGLQALLGMWTVTLLLRPLVVVAHLLGGMLILFLLWALMLQLAFPSLRQGRRGEPGRVLRPWVWAGLTVAFLQVGLGGWTSANYAALACPDFPTCHGQWWPRGLEFRAAFFPAGAERGDYGAAAREGAGIAIHFAHRLGALAMLLAGLLISLRAFLLGHPPLYWSAALLLAILLAQWALGVANVLFGLPAPVAVAHNAGAALLLLALGTLLHQTLPPMPGHGGGS